MVVVVRMKNTSAMPGFLSTSFMGELVKEKNGLLLLKSTCVVLEALNRDQQGNSDVRLNYMCTSMVSNGVYEIKLDEISAKREVDQDDEFMKGYNDAIEAMRLSKSNLQRAAQMPPAVQNPNINLRARN